MKYYVVFVNDSQPETNYGIMSGPHDTLEQAAKARHVSGDLIFDSNGELVASYEWLWKWEAADDQFYACRKVKQALEDGITIKLNPMAGLQLFDSLAHVAFTGWRNI